MTNRENIVSLMEDYIRSLQQMVSDLKQENGQAIFDCFERSGAYRSSISERGGATMNPEFSLFCDIPDKAGSISVLASLLAYEGISIKNIGINNNRERGEGALKIEFYDEASMTAAWKRLEYYTYEMVRL